MLKDILRTKHVSWKYESEIRKIFDKSQCEQKKNYAGSIYFKEFNEGLKLTRVILGFRCTNEIKKAMSKFSVPIIITRPAFTKYKIIANEKYTD